MKCFSFSKKTFAHLKDQATNVEAYNYLSKQINMSFQKVFERLIEMNSKPLLASWVGLSHREGGGGIIWENNRDNNNKHLNGDQSHNFIFESLMKMFWN